jgi:hypothetical protein
MKNYYFANTAAFDAFVAGQESSPKTEGVLEKIKEQYGDSLPEDGIVIFEKTNIIRKRKPRPVTSDFVMESTRKIGPRAKKENADETSGEETAAPRTRNSNGTP